jgi:hypothetical protein
MEPDGDLIGGADILPFPAQAGGPAPAQRWSCVYDLDGVPVQFVGELYADADAARLSGPARGALIADPDRPGCSWLLRLDSLATRSSAFPLSEAEIAAWSRGDAPVPRFRG